MSAERDIGPTTPRGQVHPAHLPGRPVISAERIGGSQDTRDVKRDTPQMANVGGSPGFGPRDEYKVHQDVAAAEAEQRRQHHQGIYPPSYLQYESSKPGATKSA